MHIQVDPGSPVPLYCQVIEQIRLALASGLLKPGDRLPGIRELAERIAINPMTVVRAYNTLIQEGVLRGRRGTGTFVAETGSRGEVSRREKKRIAGKWIGEAVARCCRLGLDRGEILEVLEDCFEEPEGRRASARRGG